MKLTPNTLAFIALANEYCSAVENLGTAAPEEFTASMLRLLPRIYMAATDLEPELAEEPDDDSIHQALDEETYDSIRTAITELLGADDVYLEVFMEEMKYSDTPIGASISESLADLYQVFFNFISTVKYLDPEEMMPALATIKTDFADYWSQTLCNVLRPLNHIRYSSPTLD
ncbi:MAG: DUF5063 domain-containing protein [Lachnoclostridium sp.]|nr:DUF5063 domain-containing protein [Lachnoclostridium sp.]